MPETGFGMGSPQVGHCMRPRGRAAGSLESRFCRFLFEGLWPTSPGALLGTIQPFDAVNGEVSDWPS